jgi:hypothetical protein
MRANCHASHLAFEKVKFCTGILFWNFLVNLILLRFDPTELPLYIKMVYNFTLLLKINQHYGQHSPCLKHFTIFCWMKCDIKMSVLWRSVTVLHHQIMKLSEVQGIAKSTTGKYSYFIRAHLYNVLIMSKYHFYSCNLRNQEYSARFQLLSFGYIFVSKLFSLLSVVNNHYRSICSDSHHHIIVFLVLLLLQLSADDK